MQLYKVKGADGGVYGPVFGVVIQEWITEGRLNGESLVAPDETENWRPLRDYPEFIPALTMAAVNRPAATASTGMNAMPERQMALTAAKTPGLLLVILGALMCLVTVASLVGTIFQGQSPAQQLPPEAPEWLRNLFQMQANMPKWVSYGQFVVSAIVDAMMIVAGLNLMRLKNRGLAMTGAILACLPCFTSCCCLLGLPLGIWAVTVCNRPDVRPHFDS